MRTPVIVDYYSPLYGGTIPIARIVSNALMISGAALVPIKSAPAIRNAYAF